MTTEALRALLDDADERRRGYVAAVAALPPDARTVRPGPDSWSPLEILEHLVLAERDVLRSLFSDGGPRPRPRSLRNRVLYGVVMGILRFGVRVRVPSPKMAPTGAPSFEGLQAMWDETHARLRSHIDGSGPAELRLALFGHPVSGPLDTGQAVRMLHVHLKHHEKQFAAAVEAAGAG